MNKTLINHLLEMKNSSINNYVLPGLESSLIGGGDFGRVRYFEASRSQQDSITPHTHRFDFCCLVLQGSVVNRIWTPCADNDGDFFEETRLDYCGDIGKYKKTVEGRDFYGYHDDCYRAGDTYRMYAEEMHSIIFSKDAKVLFFEGVNASDSSLIIEPVVDGKKTPTFKTEKWMFSK